MMSRWDPFSEALSLRDAMNQLMEQAVLQPGAEGRNRGTNAGFAPALDVRETPDEYIVEASLPGVKPENVNIQLHEGVLTISGEIHEERSEGQPQQTQQAGQTQGQQSTQHGQRQSTYHLRERRYGRFFRSITLPTQVDPNKAQATFEHGVLMLTIPKAEETKPRRIQIRTGGAQQESAPQIQGSGAQQGGGSTQQESMGAGTQAGGSTSHGTPGSTAEQRATGGPTRT